MIKNSVSLLFYFIFVLSHAQTWQKIDSIAYNRIESKPDSAITIYKKYLPDIKKQYSTKSIPYLTFLSHVAYSYNIKQKYKVCDSLYALTIKQLDELHLTRTNIFFETVNNYFASLFEQGKYLQAENLFKQYLVNIDSIASKSEYSSILNNLASLYDVMGKVDDSILLFQKSLALIAEKEGKESEQYASTLNNLALCYKRAGNYPMAERLYENAKEIRKNVLGENHIKYAITCNNLAALYSAQGKIQEAIEMYKKVELIYTHNNKTLSKEYAYLCNNLGAIYARIKQYDIAEEYHLKAKKIREEILGKNSQDYAQSCSNLGSLYASKGELAKAKKELSEAIELTQKNESINTAQYLKYLFNQAHIYIKENNLYSAESLTVSILTSAKKILPEQHPQITSFKATLALIYRKQNKMDLADKLFIEIVDAKMAEIKQNFSNLSQSDKESYINRNLIEYLMEFYTQVSIRHKENPNLVQKAFDITNLTKGMIINSINKIKQQILNSSDTSLKSIYIKWQNMQKEIAKITSMTLFEQKKRKINIDSLIRLSNQYEKKISEKVSYFQNAKEDDNILCSTIQAKLQSGEAAIEIVRVSSEDTLMYLVFILKNFSSIPELVVIPDGKKMEKEYLINYKRSIKHKIYDPYSYGVFWKPIREKLNNVKKVYISNDGVYHLINLSAIQNPDTQDFVQDEINIIYVTNTKNIVTNTTSMNMFDINKKNYFIGNPAFEVDTNVVYPVKADTLRTFSDLPSLAGSELEVKYIVKMLPNSYFFTGKYATEDTVKRIAKEANILHIATHGYFNVSKTDNTIVDMLQAGILLAGCIDYDKKIEPDLNREDGRLTAYEIMNTELQNTELAVLSACETGMGIFNKNGIYGLQRSLKIAGAKSIIVSIWKVNDIATQKLMIKFYENYYKKKMNKYTAFLNAQQELRKEYPEPYYWGAFIMVQ